MPIENNKNLMRYNRKGDRLNVIQLISDNLTKVNKIKVKLFFIQLKRIATDLCVSQSSEYSMSKLQSIQTNHWFDWLLTTN